jgi:hypothetical protein
MNHPFVTPPDVSGTDPQASVLPAVNLVTGHALGMNIVFHGLYAFDCRSVCELHVFEDAASRVVVATEVEDNPGMSVFNAVDSLARGVERDFGSLETTLIAHSPGDEPLAPNWAEAPIHDAEGDWNATSRERVEKLVGVSLSEPAREQHTMAAVGGEQHPLLGLIEEEEEFRPLGSRLTVVPVTLLPWPHNPSRCPHHARFEQIAQLYPPACWTTGAAGAHFFLTLTDRHFRACSYHEPDWREVARVSVEVLEALPLEAERDEAITATSGRFKETLEAEALNSLFTDPIVWSPASGTVTNGQHRTCALKASGAPLCVIDTYGESVRLKAMGDPKDRARADLAAFWADQTFQPDDIEREPHET